MLSLAFPSSPKCQCFAGIQLSWKDRQADRAVCPRVCCTVLKALPQHDLCDLVLTPPPYSSVISTPCGACCKIWLGALMFAVLLASMPFIHVSYCCRRLGSLWLVGALLTRFRFRSQAGLWLNRRSVRNQPFWDTKLVRHKAEHMLINCSRHITKDLRAYLEATTQKLGSHHLGIARAW